ncbi:hypothetical protein ACIQUY_03690 [Streptomyces sp. NPDC090231]|uniref:hypothetical protein n=1 Tax=unclassified Streptomyces TaxID=2593676 RepID=UPI002E124F1D|nr:hypothetical protein OG384_10575 [Streptomyces sp. NBC_01324]
MPLPTRHRTAPRLFANRWPEGIGPNGRPIHRERCTCFDQYRVRPRARVGFHGEQQDTSSAGWLRLLALVEEALADGREEFNPLVELSPQERRDVITLPASIGRLTTVKHLRLLEAGAQHGQHPLAVRELQAAPALPPVADYGRVSLRRSPLRDGPEAVGHDSNQCVQCL